MKIKLFKPYVLSNEGTAIVMARLPQEAHSTFPFIGAVDLRAEQFILEQWTVDGIAKNFSPKYDLTTENVIIDDVQNRSYLMADNAYKTIDGSWAYVMYDFSYVSNLNDQEEFIAPFVGYVLDKKGRKFQCNWGSGGLCQNGDDYSITDFVPKDIAQMQRLEKMAEWNKGDKYRKSDSSLLKATPKGKVDYDLINSVSVKAFEDKKDE